MKIKVSIEKLSAALVILSEDATLKTKETGGVWVLEDTLFASNVSCYYTDDVDCNKKGASIFIPTEDVQDAMTKAKQDKQDCITFEKIGPQWYTKAKGRGHLTTSILEATKGDIKARQAIIKKAYRVDIDDACIFNADNIALGLKLFKALNYGMANVKLLQENQNGLIFCDVVTNAKFHIMPMQWTSIKV